MNARTIATNLLDYNKWRQILNQLLLTYLVWHRPHPPASQPASQCDATPYSDRSNKLHTHPSLPFTSVMFYICTRIMQSYCLWNEPERLQCYTVKLKHDIVFYFSKPMCVGAVCMPADFYLFASYFPPEKLGNLHVLPMLMSFQRLLHTLFIFLSVGLKKMSNFKK